MRTPKEQLAEEMVQGGGKEMVQGGGQQGGVTGQWQAEPHKRHAAQETKGG
jgi:hypothetical protein